MEDRDTFVELLTELATTSESQERFDEEAETEKNNRIAKLLNNDDLKNYHLKFDDAAAVAVQKPDSIFHVLTLLEDAASKYENQSEFKEYKGFFGELKKYACIFKVTLENFGESTEKSETDGMLDRALALVERVEKETRNNKNETLTTVLTVLGIFVAVIIAVVAVYLNGVADKNTLSLPLSRQLLLSALRWHATFLLIFFLIFLIAKLTGRSLAGMCKDAAEADQSGGTGRVNKSCDCSVCSKNCGKVKQIRKRFPWFVLMNIAFFAVEFSALFVEIHGWSNIKGWFGLEFCDVNWWGIITDSAISHWILAFLPVLVWILWKRLGTGGTAKSDSAEE